MTVSAVAGFHAAGEAAAAKHFPGHGDTDVDSHTGLPIIHHTLAQWRQIDAPPFQAAIRAGVDEVMIGHIEVPATGQLRAARVAVTHDRDRLAQGQARLPRGGDHRFTPDGRGAGRQ